MHLWEGTWRQPGLSGGTYGKTSGGLFVFMGGFGSELKFGSVYEKFLGDVMDFCPHLHGENAIYCDSCSFPLPVKRKAPIMFVRNVTIVHLLSKPSGLNICLANFFIRNASLHVYTSKKYMHKLLGRSTCLCVVSLHCVGDC